jgi:DNA-binding winged helix-turn-helix (wHTH) protein
MPVTPSTSVVRFGGFELDPVGRELCKQGHKIKIQDQPLSALVLLLQSQGRVITRKEFHRVFWRSDVFVDFDHGLNRIMHKLRRVLEDSAQDPQFIKTVGRGKGYQFLMPVETIPSPDSSSNDMILEQPQKQPVSPAHCIDKEKQITLPVSPYGTTRFVELAFGCGILAVVALADAGTEIALGQWSAKASVSYLLDGVVAGGVAAILMDVLFRYLIRGAGRGLAARFKGEA